MARHVNVKPIDEPTSSDQSPLLITESVSVSSSSNFGSSVLYNSASGGVGVSDGEGGGK